MSQIVSAATKKLALDSGLNEIVRLHSNQVGWREGNGLPVFVVEGTQNNDITDTPESPAQVRILDNISSDQYSVWSFKSTSDAIKAVSNPLFRQVSFLDFFSQVQDENPLRAALMQHRTKSLYFDDFGQQLLSDKDLLTDWTENRLAEFSGAKTRLQISYELSVHGMHLIQKGLTPNVETVVKKFIQNLPNFSTDEILENCKKFTELMSDAGFSIRWDSFDKTYPMQFSIDIDVDSDRNLLNTPELIPDEIMEIESQLGETNENTNLMDWYCDELAERGYIGDYDLSHELVFVVKAIDLDPAQIDLETHSYLLSPGEQELFPRKSTNFSPS